MYMSVKQAAQLWGISDRRVRDLASQGKIAGAVRQGRLWNIPVDAKKPTDSRYKKADSLLPLIDEKMAKLSTLRPLTAGEVERLNEEFTVGYTYNSKAIEGNTQTLGVDVTATDFLPFSDVAESVREDMALLRNSPLIPSDVVISGGVYDVDTGRIHVVE